MTRRRVLGAGLGVLAGAARGATPDVWDFAERGIAGWTVVDGEWSLREMSDVPGWTRRVLMQHATGNAFNVIVAPLGPFTDVEVSVKFRPITGREDASGGIVFRFADRKYYLIRANALEDNFRFYYYDGGRRMLSSANVRAPALGQWHALRVVAEGERVQGWLDGTPLLDARDPRFKAGRVGLWTKADSVTAFDEFSVSPLTASR